MAGKSGWSRAQTFMVISIALATFMTSLDASIVSIAIPTITEEFHTTTGVVSWIIIIYGLLLSSLLLTFGKLADTMGFKKLFMIGLIIFTIGSMLSGMASSIEDLIAYRGLQAVGGSIMAALTLAMVSHYLPADCKGKGLGVVSTFMALGVALGPVIGGVLTQYLSWRWIFFVNIPVCLIALLMGQRYIPADEKMTAKKKGFDIPGAVLFFTSIFAFLLAMNMGSEWGWTSIAIIGLFILAVISLGLFILCESKVSSPMLKLALVRNRNILAENFAGLAIMGSVGGMFLLMPFYFEIILGKTTSETGFLLLSSSVAIMIFGMISGKLSDRSGSRKLCIAGTVITTAAFCILSTLGVGTSIIVVLLGLFILGVGFGFYLSPASNLILRQTSKEDEGVSTGLLNTTRNLGYVIGLTIMETVFSLTVPTLTHATKEELMAGFQAAFVTGVIICAVAVFFSYIAKDGPTKEKECIE
jgi:EmrB/QacA subfamily drug resistance transporter